MILRLDEGPKKVLKQGNACETRNIAYVATCRYTVYTTDSAIMPNNSSNLIPIQSSMEHSQQ